MAPLQKSLLVLYLLLRLCPICISVTVSPPPLAGHSYVLSNYYSGTFSYLSWTANSSLANNVNPNTPGVCMGEENNPTTVPTGSGWLFDLQSDGTYRIYNTDNDFSSTTQTRLDVQADGLTPFLNVENDDVSVAGGQVWQVTTQSDEASIQIYNKLWSTVLDINGVGGGVGPAFTNYPVNDTVMNSVVANADGQHWVLGDITPTTTITSVVTITETSTITPVGETSIIATSISISTDTIISTSNSVSSTVPSKRSNIPQNSIKKRQIPAILTVTDTTTITSTTTFFTTLPTSIIPRTMTSTSVLTITQTIPVGGATNGSSSATTSNPASSGGLSVGSKVAVGFAVPLAAFGAVGVYFAYKAHRRGTGYSSRRSMRSLLGTGNGKPELPG